MSIAGDTIRRLSSFDADGLPVTSAYVGVDAGDVGRRSVSIKVGSLLHRIRPLTDDANLSHAARLSLRGDVERLEDVARNLGDFTGTLAIFSCSGAGRYEQLELARPIRDRIMVDSTPWVRPALAVLDEEHPACVVIVDRAHAQVFELRRGELTAVATVRDPVLRKDDFAGWYALEEHRVRNRADGLERRHFRHVAAVLDELHRRHGYELLTIGGHRHEVPRFTSFLSRELQRRVAGTFCVDPGTATGADIRRGAGAIIERYERDEERRWVTEVLESAAAGGLATLGAEHCLWAGTVAAIQALLLEDGTQLAGVVCDRCGWLALEGERCPLCENGTRRTNDVLDELAETVIDEGGSVEHVFASTDLRRHSVAASLRFPLPPQPGQTG